MKRRSRDCVCYNCQKSFDRGYAIAAPRAAKPQFCCRECQYETARKKAIDALPIRFWENVNVLSEDECWPWTGRTAPRGYGLIDIEGRPEIASRISLEMKLGLTLAPEVFACHSCDNPICVNPSHLFPGTCKDNMVDASEKGRLAGGNGRRGSDVGTSRLTEEQALEIKRSEQPAKVFAAKYGVSKTAIYFIRRGKNWGWLNAEG